MTRDKAYHHGDLATALVDAAEELLEEKGVNGLGLREVARRVGVSAMAPYRHFSDREALLAAVAARGFERFGASLREAAVANPTEPFSAMGYAYIAYARAHKGMFQLMFGPEIAQRKDYPALRERMDMAFEKLVGGAQQEGVSEVETRVRAIQAWCAVHGLAHLILDGIMPPEKIETAIRGVTGFKGT
jgi:AcrR family transcriptional regulator